MKKFPRPWLTWAECEEMCRLAGFTKYTWVKLKDAVPVNQPGQVRNKRYGRDALAEVLFPG